jgi:hypothetical protein
MRQLCVEVKICRFQEKCGPRLVDQGRRLAMKLLEISKRGKKIQPNQLSSTPSLHGFRGLEGEHCSTVTSLRLRALPRSQSRNDQAARVTSKSGPNESLLPLPSLLPQLRPISRKVRLPRLLGSHLRLLRVSCWAVVE